MPKLEQLAQLSRLLIGRLKATRTAQSLQTVGPVMRSESQRIRTWLHTPEGKRFVTAAKVGAPPAIATAVIGLARGGNAKRRRKRRLRPILDRAARKWQQIVEREIGEHAIRNAELPVRYTTGGGGPSVLGGK